MPDAESEAFCLRLRWQRTRSFKAAIRDNGDMSQGSALNISPKDRFDLPKVLGLLRRHGCSREDLFDYLRLGRLRAVCFPYRLEPKREIPIEPDEWQEWFRDSFAFAVYDGWIGELDVAEHETPIPLHIVPRAARADCDHVLKDGGKAAMNAPVYVLGDELIRFAEWLRAPTKSRPGRRREGAGRPRKHDYSRIDACLETLLKKVGRAGFEQMNFVTAHLRDQLGEAELPPDSTLRNHITQWLQQRAATNR